MTFQQLQYVAACDEMGSISTAAQHLFTSVSNMSRAISSLEQEVGFKIFIRTSNGTITTPKGSEFIRHANVILSEYDRMMGIYKGDQKLIFSCACPPMPYCTEAFTTLFKKHNDDSNAEFTLFEGSFNDCCSRVIMHIASLAVVVIPELNEVEHYKILHENELQAFPLVTFQYYVKLRKDHPALQGADLNNFDLSKLEKYPSIDYQCGSYDNQPPIFNFNNRMIINSKRRIHVNSMDRKIYCMQHTDAYSISLGRVVNELDEQGLVNIPLNSSAKLCYVKNRSERLSSLSIEFIDLLQDELERQQNAET